MDSPESSDSIEIDEIDDNCNYVDNDESDSSQSSNLTLEIDDTLLDSFCYIKGRRYQRSDYITYFFPNDDEEGNVNLYELFFFLISDEKLINLLIQLSL